MEVAMRRLFILVFAVGAGLSFGAAQAQSALDNVISEQLDAFNDRDIVGAFDFASPMIKRIFGRPENFGIMVQRSFPMIWDNTSVRFLAKREEGGAIFQRVLVIGKDGIAYMFDYKMIETQQGWQIDGVNFVPTPDVGA
jgi:hypothetical protein